MDGIQQSVRGAPIPLPWHGPEFSCSAPAIIESVAQPTYTLRQFTACGRTPGRATPHPAVTRPGGCERGGLLVPATPVLLPRRRRDPRIQSGWYAPPPVPVVRLPAGPGQSALRIGQARSDGSGLPGRRESQPGSNPASRRWRSPLAWPARRCITTSTHLRSLFELMFDAEVVAEALVSCR